MSSFDLNSFEDLAATFDGLVFGFLALLGARRAIIRRDRSAMWFSLLFGALAVVILVSAIHPSDGGDSLAVRLPVAVLALVPWFLYRFARTLAHGNPRVDHIAAAFTMTLVTWSMAMSYPSTSEPWKASFAVFVGAFLTHWLVLTVAAGWYFAQEAARSAGVARRRMRLFAGAAATLALALVLSGIPPQSGISEQVAIAIQLLGMVAAVGFWIALAPPSAVRAVWRTRELAHVQLATIGLVSGETSQSVRERLVDGARRLTGAHAVVLVNEDNQPVARIGCSEERALQLVTLSDMRTLRAGRLVAQMGPATPFLGVDETRMLETLSTIGTLAEERASVLELERTANQRLRDVDELKNEFVAMVAHDLRSPMSVISGFADTLHDRWDHFPDEQKLEFLQLISRNTRSLSTFVEDVLHVARIDSGALVYHSSPFDARSVVERVVAEMRLTSPHLWLEVRSPAELPQVLGDEERTWQVVTNLVTNAVKFAGETDPRISVRLSMLEDERAIAIAVVDNGIGISPEDVPRLFGRFARVGTTNRKIPGTGLGLYIVKSFVEAQGGRVWVTSEAGRGSTFTCTLPIAEVGAP